MQNIIKIMDREDKETSYRNRGVTLMGVHALEFIKDYVNSTRYRQHIERYMIILMVKVMEGVQMDLAMR